MTTHHTDNFAVDLPVATIMDGLKTALQRHAAAVLVAPPGSGKTTTVPLLLLGEPWCRDKRILLLAPRRLAARSAARRMAYHLGESVGQTVGYRVRLENRTSDATRIVVITEGVLTRMTQSDPSLEGVGLIIFDEFHERSLDADLGLALCLDVQGVLNEALKILVMSATLDTAAVVGLLKGAPLIRSDGRTYPVETHYLPPPSVDRREGWIVEAIRRAVAADDGSILVFLPGAPEIRRIARRLTETALPAKWRVAPLFGNLSRAMQDAAIAPSPVGQYKIVLASAVAETSLTIEGIRVVVDSGMQRLARFDPISGMTRLVTLPVSRASADQRRGRAGRLGPGICYRLWSEASHRTLQPHHRPEILGADLSALILELALWGVASPEALAWLDPPPASSVAEARRLLRALDGLDESGGITTHGRQMATLPLHPRLAHMVLMARSEDAGATACTLAAILSERDPLSFDRFEKSVDLALRVEAVDVYRRGRQLKLPGCTVDTASIKRIVRSATMLRKRLGMGSDDAPRKHLGRLLAWAYPDRVGQLRGDRAGRYRLANGRGARLDLSDPLGAERYIVAAHLDGERHEARIFLAAATDSTCLEEQFGDRLQWVETAKWDPGRQQVTAFRQKKLDALTLTRHPQHRPDPEAVLTALLGGICDAGLNVLPWRHNARTWQARVMLLARTDAAGGPWPDVSDEALSDTLATWLGPFLVGMTKIKTMSPKRLFEALEAMLTWRQRQLLQKLAPTHVTVPSGSRLPIDYSGPEPVLAVRIQEMFGTAETPAIADGKVPLRLHLLSPAGRPAQITQDLAGFWKNSYPDAKRELMGRYPKHPWPDDPRHAQPTARAKPKQPH